MQPRRLAAALASLLVPPRCVACTAPADPSSALCPHCASALRDTKSGESVLTLSGDEGLPVCWASAYSGLAMSLVHALKFGRRTLAARPMAGAILNNSPEILRFVSGGFLVPVPAAPSRRRARGFDPAEEITLALARATGLQVACCLARADGPRQLGRSRAARLADPPRVRVAGPRPATAVLVDDVFTTGATLAACARALGDVAVGACVFARTIGPA